MDVDTLDVGDEVGIITTTTRDDSVWGTTIESFSATDGRVLSVGRKQVAVRVSGRVVFRAKDRVFESGHAHRLADILNARWWWRGQPDKAAAQAAADDAEASLLTVLENEARAAAGYP